MTTILNSGETHDELQEHLGFQIVEPKQDEYGDWVEAQSIGNASLEDIDAFNSLDYENLEMLSTVDEAVNNNFAFDMSTSTERELKMEGWL